MPLNLPAAMSAKRLLEVFKTPFAKFLALLTLAVAVGLFALLPTREKMVALYFELSSDDINAVLYKLACERVKHRMSEDGKAILVPESLVYQLRAAMASDGLPSGNSAIVGYEIFDKEEQLGTTSFSQNVKNIRARQGELSRTIQAFESVSKARVHLAIPQRELFSHEKRNPTASIMLTLNPGAILRPSEVQAISHLVAHSVEGLKEKDITIVDTAGNVLQAGGEDEFGLNSLHNSEYCAAFERQLKGKLEALVGRIVGAGNVEVKVNVEMSFDKFVVNSEIYDPDRSVVRSSQSREEIEINSSSSEGGEVSVSSNLPDATSEDSGSSSRSEKREDTTNYEVSKTVENKISEVGQIRQVSVSILVNDHFDSSTGTFSPRSESDMAKIEALVKGAMGYQESRDDRLVVVHMPFSNDAEHEKEPNKLQVTWLQAHAMSLIRTISIAVISLVALFYGTRLAYAFVVNRKTSVAVSSPDGLSTAGNLEKLLEADKVKFMDTLRKWMGRE